MRIMHQLQRHNFHRRDLKFSDIVPNNITIINKKNLKGQKSTLNLKSPLNWEEFVCCQVRANKTYSEAKHQFSNRNKDALMNVQSPHK